MASLLFIQNYEVSRVRAKSDCASGFRYLGISINLYINCRKFFRSTPPRNTMTHNARSKVALALNFRHSIAERRFIVDNFLHSQYLFLSLTL